MNNWRLLLLAVVVVVQPIGSFTESNLIDGRECCERSEDARLYGYRKTDERRSLDGNREDHRTANKERRLSSLDRIREERRYETIRGPMLTRSESLERSERRVSPEQSRSTEPRVVREQERRQRDTLARTREIRAVQNRNHDESRNILGQNERDFRDSSNRDTVDAIRTVRLSRDSRDLRSNERESRNTMSRLQIRTIRSNEEHRSSENRERSILKREREDVARFDTRRDSRLNALARSDGRIKFDANRERAVFDRRTQEEGTEFRRPHSSDARINEVLATRVRTVEQKESNNRDATVTDGRAKLRGHQRDTELKDRVSAIRRNPERFSGDRMRESRDDSTRLVRDRIVDRNNERFEMRRQERYESRRSMDTLRNTQEQRMNSLLSRAPRSLDMTGNDARVERRSLSLDRISMIREFRDSRLSRSFERNTREERAARIRDVRDETSNEQRQDRDSKHISRDRKTDSRRDTIRMDIREPSEKRRQQREVRNIIEQNQDSRRTATRRIVRESPEERRQQREARLSRDRAISAIRQSRNTERVKESRRNAREIPEERRLQSSPLSMNRIFSFLREVRENTERDSRKGTRQSAEKMQRDTNLSRDRNSMLREVVRDSTNQAQEAYEFVRNKEKSDLRRQVLERSMEKARITRSMSAERRNDYRQTSRASRSVDASRNREDTRTDKILAHQQIRSQDTTMEQQVATPQRLDSRRSSRSVSNRLERLVRNRDVREKGDSDRTNKIAQRVTRNMATPQTIENRPTSRIESTRLERLSRTEVKQNERRETQREEHNDDRVSSRRSSERLFAERRQRNREPAYNSREVRMTRNRGEVRSERVLGESRLENRVTVRDSRNLREERNRYEVRNERMLSERRPNRDSRNLQGEIRMDERFESRRQRDATRDSKERSLHRESRDTVKRFTWEPVAEARNEIQNRFSRTDRRDIQANNDLTMERMDRTDNRYSKHEKREESFRNDAVNFREGKDQETDAPVFSNWQMVFYTLQGVYLCGLLMQMLTENSNKTKKRSFNWWSSPKNLIKAD